MRERIRNIGNKIDIVCAVLINVVFFVILFYYRESIDGDMIGDLVIAHKAAATGKMFPNNFFYSTTLPVLFGNIGIEEILAHFGMGFYNTFFVARISEMVIYSLLICWILKLIGLGKRKFVIWAILMLPSKNFIYMLYLGGYYLWAVTTPILLLCLYKLYHEEAHQKWRGFILLFACAVSFFGGIFGVKTLMWVFAPLGLALLIRAFGREGWTKGDILFAGAIGTAVAGCIVNEKVLLEKYDVLSRIELKYVALSELPDRFGKIIIEMLKILGWQEEVALISVAGILNVIVLLFAMIMMVLAVSAIKRREEIDGFDRFIFLFSIITFVISLFLQLFTETDINGTYLAPAIWTMLLSSCIFYFKYNNEYFEQKIKRIFAYILLFFYIFSWKNIYTIFVTNMEAGIQERNTVLEILQENGYEYGYATFWNSMPIVAGTNLQIECAHINLTGDGIYYHNWLISKEWCDKTYYEGTVFIVLEKWEQKMFDSLITKMGGRIPCAVFDDGTYIIYEMENAEMTSYITD